MIRLYFSCLFLCLSSFTYACSCVDQQVPISETFAHSDLVFTGKVIAKSKNKWIGSDYYNVEFQLAENYKNNEGERVTIKTATSAGMCSFPFEVGESYLVFAYKYSAVEEKQSSASPTEYGTSLCSPTKLMKYAQVDLNELNKLKKREK